MCQAYPGGDAFDRLWAGASVSQPPLQAELAAPFCGLGSCGPLATKDNFAHYCGPAYEAQKPVLEDLLKLPQVVASLEEVRTAVLACGTVCKSILDRAADGSTPSRVALQYQVHVACCVLCLWIGCAFGSVVAFGSIVVAIVLLICPN